jgi:hypothetical protein
MTAGRDWVAIEAKIDRIIAESSEPFGLRTVANVKDFLMFVRDRCPVPEVEKRLLEHSLVHMENNLARST